jgi:FtsX-like permease family
VVARFLPARPRETFKRRFRLLPGNACRCSFDQLVGTEIRQAVQRVLPNAVPPDLVPLTAQLGNAFTDQRALGGILELLSVLAAILASVGLYGVISFSVAQRRREFGIRMALGAEERRIARLVPSDAATIVAVGTAAGLLGAHTLSILLANRLYLGRSNHRKRRSYAAPDRLTPWDLPQVFLPRETP